MAVGLRSSGGEGEGLGEGEGQFGLVSHISCTYWDAARWVGPLS